MILYLLLLGFNWCTLIGAVVVSFLKFLLVGDIIFVVEVVYER